MNPEQFAHQLAQYGLHLSASQLEQFRLYYQLLVEWNKRINLTALTEEGEVYLKHFYDSLTAAFFYDFNPQLKLADVGAGAGFPSLPLKICFPHLKVTIVDSRAKRITFLHHLVELLGLTQVDLYHARAEELGQQDEHREQYDLVLARAVARFNVLSELCLPLVKVGGTFLALKGSKGEAELQEGKGALRQLGGELIHLHRFHLPLGGGERQLITIGKKRATPKRYPRQPGLPAKKPLR